MSRQNKQAKRASIKREVTRNRKSGGGNPNGTEPLHGKRKHMRKLAVGRIESPINLGGIAPSKPVL